MTKRNFLSKNNMKSCNSAGPKNKKCIRTSDKKVFSLPRKFSKLACLLGPIKGFTMRASCAPYKKPRRFA